jgi:hypothetical protein
LVHFSGFGIKYAEKSGNPGKKSRLFADDFFVVGAFQIRQTGEHLTSALFANVFEMLTNQC